MRQQARVGGFVSQGYIVNSGVNDYLGETSGGGTFDYRTETTSMPISRACLGRPGKVRVSVVAADGGSRGDWAPGYHRFSPWVGRG
mgnify:CR=1 FL=1